LKKINTEIPGLYIIQNNLMNDNRGSFLKTFSEELFSNLGLCANFKEQFYSTSKKNVIRGMHFQKKNSQGKFISVIKGSIYDVVIDLRKKSKTFGKHYSIVLSEKNCKSIYVPDGFAHGYLVTSKESVVIYKCTNVYNPDDEYGIKWNDKTIGLKWNYDSPIISKRDLNLPALKDQRFLPKY